MISKTEFERCFQHWREWWNNFIRDEGAYFERNCPPIAVSVLVC